MKNALAAILCVLCLSGCALFGESNTIVNTCAPVKPWTAEEQGEMLKDLRALPSNSLLIPAFEDYASMRAVARACAAN